MRVARRATSTTFDEFCFLVGDGQKAVLINGVIYIASPENTDANRLFLWVGGLLSLYVENFDLGEVLGSRVTLRLDDRYGPEPDILFVRKARLHLVRRGHIAGPADLAVEIVSPDSVQRDYLTKRQQYEQAGIEENWIIDEMKKKKRSSCFAWGQTGNIVKSVRGKARSTAGCSPASGCDPNGSGSNRVLRSCRYST